MVVAIVLRVAVGQFRFVFLQLPMFFGALERELVVDRYVLVGTAVVLSLDALHARVDEFKVVALVVIHCVHLLGDVSDVHLADVIGPRAHADAALASRRRLVLFAVSRHDGRRHPDDGAVVKRDRLR